MSEFNGFLSVEGEAIFDILREHCRSKLKMEDVDDFELAMLANSFYLYSDSAAYCNENGVKMTIRTEKGGIYEQICPEYTVMKNEYQNILKHSGKFGLNPGDRSKIFKKLDQGKKVKAFDSKEKMKVA
jgi:phage terminase small subunit